MARPSLELNVPIGTSVPAAFFNHGWDSAELLPSTPFKCTGAASEALKTASTDGETVALRSDFYRAGDGNDESFTANMFVSAKDLAPDIAGVQNAWVQGVGCATATAHFSS